MFKLRNVFGAMALAIATIFMGGASQAAPMPAAGIVADIGTAKADSLVLKTHGWHCGWRRGHRHWRACRNYHRRWRSRSHGYHRRWRSRNHGYHRRWRSRRHGYHRRWRSRRW